jgi:CBS domain-containing protein
MKSTFSSINAAAASLLHNATLRDVLQQPRFKSPVTVQRDRSVHSVIDALRTSREGAVLVMDDLFAVGIFTESDLLGLLLRGVNLEQVTVGNEMSGQVILGTPEMTLGEALAFIRGNRIQHLPIAVFLGPAIDDDTRVTHILSPYDLMSFLSDVAVANKE